VTCIIATSSFLCGDKRCTSDSGEKCPNVTKVHANVGLAVGFAGKTSIAYDIARLIKEGRTDPKDFVEVAADHSTIICLDAEGKLWLASDNAVWPVRRPWYAIGSGGDLAIGYLAALGKQDKASARKAQHFAASRRADCGGGVDFRAVNG
jgi:hypothetical protein